MTWVVGMPSWFGYSIGLSDIRVTLADGSTRDCLQKVYPVGRFVALGFAGSVAIGFAMAQRARELLVGPSNSAWFPDIVAEWWPEDACAVFRSFPEAIRAHGCHLMMFAVHPVEDNGPFPQPYVYIFRSPNFYAEPVRINDAVAIGSGTEAEHCRAKLDRLCNDEDHKVELMMAENGMPGGIASVLGFDLARLLEDDTPKGVSPHMHICMVRRGSITIGENDYTRFDREGPVAFEMPKVAKSMRELEEMLSATGATAAGAVC